MKIDKFRGKYAFLSNFYDAPVEYEGLFYKNSESAFQSAKTLDMEKRKQFCELDPSTAKRKGRNIVLRHDWEKIRNVIMKEIVLDISFRNQDLKNKLIETGNVEIIEGNTWGDVYSGVFNGKGKNVLGKILMEVRELIK